MAYTKAYRRLREDIVADLGDVATLGFINYRATFAEALAAFSVGAYFSTAETGSLRLYKRIATAPGYEDQGDAAAPVNATTIPLSVKRFGAKGDGTTDDTAAVTAAVAQAIAASSTLYWPAGTYVTTASIPNFHSVRHTGPGVVKRGSVLFYVEPKNGQSNVIYVSASGSDTNDGLGSGQGFREIKAAAAALANYNGSSGAMWTIRVGAGTFKGGIVIPRGWGDQNFVKIVGDSVTHPTSPTAIIDKAADTTATAGYFASDGTLAWLENIKFIGAFDQGVYIARNSYLQWRNVHVDGAKTGLQINVHCRYYVYGGIIQNCTVAGINELFHVTRSFATVSSAAEQMVIQNCPVGFKTKENCVGHLDYLTVQDCPVGVQFHLFSGANVGNLNLKRNMVGVILIDSEMHEFGGIVWGSGADANTVPFKMMGKSTIDNFGWTDSLGTTIDTGWAPPVTLAHDFTQTTVTGTVADTNVYTFSSVVKKNVYCAKGSKITVRVRGKTGAANLLAANRILLRIGGTYVTDVTLPTATPANSFFWAEWEVICNANGNNQICASRLVVDGASSDVTMVARTLDLTADRSVNVSVTPGNTGDSVTLWNAEVIG